MTACLQQPNTVPLISSAVSPGLLTLLFVCTAFYSLLFEDIPWAVQAHRLGRAVGVSGKRGSLGLSWCVAMAGMTHKGSVKLFSLWGRGHCRIQGEFRG